MHLALVSPPPVGSAFLPFFVWLGASVRAQVECACMRLGLSFCRPFCHHLFMCCAVFGGLVEASEPGLRKGSAGNSVECWNVM